MSNLQSPISVLQIYLKETPAKVLSYELCQISKNTIFIKHLCMTASENHVFLISNWIIIDSLLQQF